MPALAFRRLAPLIALAAVTGCLSTANPNDTALVIELSNLNTATPTFSWPAGGPMTVITLTTSADPNTILWQVQTPGADGIAPPIVYGDAGPTGAVRTGSLAPLVTGTEYRISIRRLDGIGGVGRFRKP